MLARLLRVPTALPRLTLLALAALAVASATAVPGLRSDFGIEGLLPRGDPEVERYLALADEYGRDDNTVYVFLVQEGIFTEPGAREVIALTRALEDSELVEEVVGLATATLVEDRDGTLWVGPPFDEEQLPKLDLAALGRRLRSNPVYAGRIVSADGGACSFAVRIRNELYGDAHRPAVVGHVMDTLARFERPGRELLVTGNPPIRAQYIRFIRKDAAVFLGAAGLLLAIALLVIFRSAAGVALPLLAVGLSVLYTLALMRVTGRPINLLGSAIPVLVLIVGISDAIHLLTRYHEELAGGLPKPDALGKALVATARACLLTSITTSSGFFVLPATGIPMLSDFGVSVGAGVLIAYAVTMTLIPAAATLLPEPAAGRSAARAGRVLEGLCAVVTRRPGRVALGSAAFVVAFAAVGGPRLRVESRVVDDLPPGHPVLRTRDQVEERMGGNFPMQVLIHAGGPGAAEEPELIAAVAAFQRALAEGEPERGRVLSGSLSAADFLGMAWRELGGEGALPPSPEAVAQVSVVLGEDRLERYYDRDRTLARIELRVYDRGTQETFRFVDRLRAAFARTAGDRARLEVQGFTYMAHQVHREIVWSSLTSFTLDFAIVALLVMLLFRSLRLTVLAILPNVLPLVVTLGFMGMAGIDLRISSSIVFSIVFGIAVDDTVHFLARFHEERAAGLPAREAAARTMTTTGRAMVFMAFVLATGFSVLTLSEFSPNRVLGLLMAATVASGVLADLVMLPALLVVGHRRESAA